MFRQIAATIPGGAEFLFRLHPVELSGLLEQAWHFRSNEYSESSAGRDIGDPYRRSDIPSLPESLLGGFDTFDTNKKNFQRTGDNTFPCPDGCIRWHHLIYAFCIEQSRVYDVFRKVLHHFRHGEELGVPLEGSEHWLRNTEELFFRDPPPFFINSLNSWVRPNLDASRRNAYWRMFGMDLSHKGPDGEEVPFVKPSASNVEFISTFENFLREVWIAIVNINNQAGVNVADPGEIANHSLMSWFHLTLDSNTTIVRSLRAEGVSPEQRLFKIAERATLPAHALSKSWFDMAEEISALLILIETGIFNDPAAVPALYDPSLPPVGNQRLEPLLRKIITHWSITTGRDLKFRALAGVVQQPQMA